MSVGLNLLGIEECWIKLVGLRKSVGLNLLGLEECCIKFAVFRRSSVYIPVLKRLFFFFLI